MKFKYEFVWIAVFVLVGISAFLLNDFLGTYSNSIMVIITCLYVMATFEICRANIKSAEENRKQLEEIKRQFAEENRPIIEMELCYERRTWYILRFVNVGRRSAQHVKIRLDQSFIDNLPGEAFRTSLNKTKDKECIIGVEKHYDLYIGSNELLGHVSGNPVSGTITYESDGNCYSEDIFLDLEQYMTFFSSNTDEEEFLKTIKEIELDLKALNK